MAKIKRDLGFPCDISKKHCANIAPFLLALSQRGYGDQFQDHIGGLCHFLTVGDDATHFWAFLGQLFKMAMMSPAVCSSRFRRLICQDDRCSSETSARAMATCCCCSPDSCGHWCLICVSVQPPILRESSFSLFVDQANIFPVASNNQSNCNSEKDQGNMMLAEADLFGLDVLPIKENLALLWDCLDQPRGRGGLILLQTDR